MKTIGLTLLIVGVALCAMYGSRTTVEHSDRLAALGRATLALKRSAKDHKAYCSEAIVPWEAAVKQGCHPWDSSKTTKSADPQACVQGIQIGRLAIKDGCSVTRAYEKLMRRHLLRESLEADAAAGAIVTDEEVSNLEKEMPESDREKLQQLQKRVDSLVAEFKVGIESIQMPGGQLPFHHPGYCSHVAKQWLQAVTKEGCDPLGKVENATSKSASSQKCAKFDAMLSRALNQECDLTSTFLEVTYPFDGVSRFSILGRLAMRQHAAAQRRLLPRMDGIYRVARTPWRAIKDGHDLFLELMPNGDASLYSVAHDGNAQRVHARGDRVRSGTQVTVNLCGVGQTIDIGCSRNVFQFQGGRLTLTSVSADGGVDRRPVLPREYVLLALTYELKNKYKDQRRTVARLRVLKGAAMGVKLPDPIRKRRAGWLASYGATIGPRSEVAGLQPATLVGLELQVDATRGTIKGGPTQSGGARLSAWFGRYGMGFMLGLVILFAGGIISRRTIRAEAVAEPKAGEEKAVDFGEMLHETSLQVAAHAQEMASLTLPSPADFDRFKTFVEDTQLESIQRLVEAKDRLQVRYGIAVFAAVFGPLSKGERYLNRVWSALVDIHWPEATRSMRIAGAALADAHAEIVAATGDEPAVPAEDA